MKYAVINATILTLAIWALSSCNNGKVTQGSSYSNEEKAIAESGDSCTKEVYRIKSLESTILNEHRVYLWDVSESLLPPPKGNGMWGQLKEAIKQSIESIQENPNNRISIVTFYSSAPIHQLLNIKADASGKAQLLNFINQQGDKAVPDGKNYTNIISAFEKFECLIIPGYKNYLFLYTDGGHEDSKLKRVTPESKQVLLDKISTWDTNIANNRKIYGFYVLVNQEADKDHKIEDVATRLSKFHVVPDANVSIKIIGFPEEYPYNVYDKESLDMNNKLIGITGDYDKFEGDIKLQANDSLYNLSFIPDVKEGWVKVNVIPKHNDIDEGEYPIKVSVSYEGTKDPYSFIEDTTFIVRCINKREHFAELSLTMNMQEDNIGRTSYTPGFWWSDEEVVSQSAILDVKFNKYAERANCSFDLSFVDGDKNPLKYDDFKVVADGDTLSGDNPIHITGTRKIQLEFIPSEGIDDNHFAGYIVFSNQKGIDRINTKDVIEQDNIVTEWGFKHARKWNQLFVLVVCLFLLWFVFTLLFSLKNNVFSKKIWDKSIYSPDNLLVPIAELNGCRRCYLTSKRESGMNSGIHRIYCGPIQYVKIPGFKSDIVIFAKSTDYDDELFLRNNDEYVINNIPLTGNYNLQPNVMITIEHSSTSTIFRLLIN